ncbi:hypothetical protein [Rhodoplanes sp. Z2-YC6860]|uniref:hypothetical protein n=1 Tax=Rhodoplanes sp. Z2-YC6860 TaxID=674703 RepID=UPI00078BD740|nr:hypothetical protein [Rhodoplanes sp. Z2-YC6860]AMN42634.1 hypothetical protein RHPLAN_42030 [Rhodoplanes sp. Z2-YC6860]
MSVRVWIALAGACLLASCASKSSEITAAYVSPMTYQSYSCQQLGMEAQAVSTKAAELSGAQDQKRTIKSPPALPSLFSGPRLSSSAATVKWQLS